MKIATLVLIATLTLAPVAHAYTVSCTNCSNTAMQALEYALSSQQLANLKQAYDQYVEQTAKQLRMVQQNVEQYANMVQNTVLLPANIVKEISNELSKLSQITGTLNTIRQDVMGMSNVFDELYRTQDEFKNLANLPSELLSGGGSTYNSHWDNWSKRVDTATQATFQLSGKQLKELEESGQLESYINKLLSTPDGQQQALMAGNNLAAIQIQESRQLRELIATKFQSDLATQEKSEKVGQMSEELHRQMLDGQDNISTNSKADPF
ncbi:MAG: P-type conjugative transfer protein TrbJ [Acidaminococcaceae bacterium]|nr:P-type conjugative transfer protein TrbJ [Acidaminococcaceae bacterium]